MRMQKFQNRTKNDYMYKSITTKVDAIYYNIRNIKGDRYKNNKA